MTHYVRDPGPEWAARAAEEERRRVSAAARVPTPAVLDDPDGSAGTPARRRRWLGAILPAAVVLLLGWLALIAFALVADGEPSGIWWASAVGGVVTSAFLIGTGVLVRGQRGR